MLLICFLSSGSVVHADVSEPDLRAAVILGILKYTDFPEHKPVASVINLCVLGNPASKKSLQKFSAEYKVNSRDIFILTSEKNLKECDAAVIGSELNKNSMKELSKNTKSLIVCDDCTAGQEKASAVVLFRDGQRIRFIIDLHNSLEKEIKLSSSLLELAMEVRKP